MHPAAGAKPGMRGRARVPGRAGEALAGRRYLYIEGPPAGSG